LSRDHRRIDTTNLHVGFRIQPCATKQSNMNAQHSLYPYQIAGSLKP
jgi:hypothetical protein